MSELWGVYAERKITMTSFVCLGRALAVAAHRDSPVSKGHRPTVLHLFGGLGRWDAVPA